jgi:hypothetical protein
MFKLWKEKKVLVMSNLLANWWRSYQFRAALQQGNTRLAEQKLNEIEKSGAKLSWLEKLFRTKLQTEKSLHANNQEIIQLRELLQQRLQQLEELEKKLDRPHYGSHVLKLDTEFIQFVSDSFKLTEHDSNKIQCTGIDARIFEDFEANLADYLKHEFEHIPSERLTAELKQALEDINNLKSGKDPQYNHKYTPYVYFIRYFLENVYCAYLAWFLVCKEGLLPTHVNILDIAAGPGTIAYGLALLLQSSSGFIDLPQIHLSYYSLEKQNKFQYRGLQFWRRYIEPQPLAANAYFRFDTTDIFNYDGKHKKLPKNFFDFVVISHCLFNDAEARSRSHKILENIVTNSLKEDGYVLLIIQGKKLFKAYKTRLSEDIDQERRLIEKLLAEMGLSLVWYKYLTSTGQRTPMDSVKFGNFARENLPVQKFISSLGRQYLRLNYDLCYTLDDYVILAKR